MTENAPDQAEPTRTPTSEKKCPELTAPTPPPVQTPPRDCPQPCCCPEPPPTPPGCFDEVITKQTQLVTEAERAKSFLDTLNDSKNKVKSALADYTQTRYKDLRKRWEDQDELITGLTGKLECSVPCWECLLECRLCPELVAIRNLEDRLNGDGSLTTEVYSLFDLQYWHQRNVTQLQAQVDRIAQVLAAWEKPSDTLGEALDKNEALIEEVQGILSTDSAKAVYDVFMTLIPRHWAIRPRDATSKIEQQFIDICECDDGTPDDCCGPDVGILSLRARLVGPLPYIADPARFTDIVCCLVKERLAPANELLAKAQANLKAVSDEIEAAGKAISDRTESLESTFRAELGSPIDCSQYKEKEPARTTPPRQNGGQSNTKYGNDTAF